MVESNRATPGERRRAAEEAAIRRRKIDVALGGAGVVLVFASSVVTIAAPSLALLPFIVLEIAGLALILFSFVRLRTMGPVTPSARTRQK
jgi:hypothetical protein